MKRREFIALVGPINVAASHRSCENPTFKPL
jgi:hypothetical protein